MKKQLSITEYHQAEGISKSKLDLIERSARHYLNPPQYESKSMDFGSMVHDCILLPEVFKSTYVKAPEGWDLRKKVFKELKEAYDLQEKVVMAPELYDAALSIRERIMAFPITRNIIERSEPEMSYFSEIDGMKVKCRPDALDGDTMIDLKTTRDPSPEAFKWAIKRYSYHKQASFYPAVYQAATGEKINNFIFVAIENQFPWSVRVYVIDRESVDLGEKEWKKNLAQIKEVEANKDKYKNDVLEIESIGLPSSAFFGNTI